ncbi:MAG: helix-turn-helix domain-containing protein [Eubacterium sp.]|nr:helix-turn-helix domain-containing protein [Eubacterium sp.]
MLFNIWMIHDLMSKKFTCTMHLQEDAEQSIRNIRLFFSGQTADPHTMYVETGDVFFANNDSRVYCVHGKNHFVVDSENVNAVFNTMIGLLEESQTRLNRITQMISEHCLLSDVLSEFRYELPYPMMVLDASQTALAISETYGKGSLDSSWDHMIETGSLGIESIARYNSLYSDAIQTKEFYHIPADPFPYPSYNRNIYINGEFMGFLSLILVHGELSGSERGWYFIAWECVSSWIRLHAENNQLLISNAVLEELLNGNLENTEYFQGVLSALGWKKNCTKQLIVLECVSSHLNMNAHIAKLLNNRRNHLYALEYQDKLVLLCNTDMLSFEKQLQTVLPIIENSGYYGGSSHPFTTLEDISHFLMQASLSVEFGTPVVGRISSCEEYILPYIFRTLKEQSHMELIHPALLHMLEKDRQRHGNDADVLYCYLKNQCNQTETAQQLHMHRSTLLRRIHQILEWTALDLSDYATRLHLLISYELLTYSQSSLF